MKSVSSIVVPSGNKYQNLKKTRVFLTLSSNTYKQSYQIQVKFIYVYLVSDGILSDRSSNSTNSLLRTVHKNNHFLVSKQSHSCLCSRNDIFCLFLTIHYCESLVLLGYNVSSCKHTCYYHSSRMWKVETYHRNRARVLFHLTISVCILE